MGLEEALEALIASEPFEGLLLERARPIEASRRGGTGRGDRRSRPRDGYLHPGRIARAARGRGARGRDRRVPRRRTRRVAARVGGAALRRHRPDPRDRRAPRRCDPPAPRGEGRVRGGRARARGHAGPDPHARCDPAAGAGRRPRAATGRARRPAGRPGLRASRSDRASRRVRGARRRGRRLPRRRPSPGPPGVLGRGDRIAPRVLHVDAALDRQDRARAGPVGARADPGRRDPRARGTPCAAPGRSVPRWVAADGRRTVRGGRRDAGPVRVRPHADRGGADAARGVGGADAGAAHTGPCPAGARGGRGAGGGDRLARTARAPSAGRGARRTRAAASLRVHAGTRPGAHRLGERAGQPRGAGRAADRSRPARLPLDRVLARPRFARSRAGVRGRASTSRRSRRRSRTASSRRRAPLPSPRRRTSSALASTRGRRRGSRPAATTRSRTSWSRGTSPSTGSTASAATRASRTVRSPVRSATT